jgi:hypothetical protein
MNRPPQNNSVSLTISNSTISALNLGTVVGDMNASLTTLAQQGAMELAQALKILSEAIASDALVGQARREYLETISLISEQGRVPEEARKTGVVRAACLYLAGAAALSANVATIWSTTGPAIMAYFGLN